MLLSMLDSQIVVIGEAVTADWQWSATALAARSPRDAACVHTGSLALAMEPSGPLIAEPLSHRCRT